MVRQFFFLLAVFILLSGCSSLPEPVRPEKKLSLTGAVSRAEEHMLDIQLEDECRRLLREHDRNTLLVSIPDRLSAWSLLSRPLDEKELAESRAALELSLLYFRAMMAANGKDAKEQVRVRIRQKLALETAECAAKYDSLLRRKKILEAVKDKPFFTSRMMKMLSGTENALADSLMSLRLMTGLPPESSFEWSFIDRNIKVPPADKVLAAALSKRPELYEAQIPEAAVAELEKMLPPLSTMHRAEQLLRFPVHLDLRSIGDKVTPPEVMALAAAWAVKAELKDDRRIVEQKAASLKKISLDSSVSPDDTELKLELEKAQYELYIAQLRLLNDCGFMPGEAVPENFALYSYGDNWRSAAMLTARIMGESSGK